MRFRFLPLSILLFYFTGGAAQQSSGGISMRGKYGNEISISDINGRPFQSEYDDIAGHPFFDNAFKYATVYLVNGRSFEHVQARLDLYKSQVNFMQQDKQEFYIPAGLVKSMVYTDSSKAALPSYVFQCGFPAAANQNPNSFYQVLLAGKCTFLKLVSKNLVTKKNDLSGEVVKEFENYEDYYLLINGEMKRLKKDKDFILQALSAKQVAVEKFMQSEKVNVRNTDHLIKLFTFYNGL